MLNNHMQAIVAYFSKTAQPESRSQSTLQPKVQPEMLRPLSHLEPAIVYLAAGRLGHPASPVGKEPVRPKQVRATSPVFARLRQFWQAMITINSEPQIRETVTASGETCWHVYDPIAQASHTFFDEEDVYRWLERRYYE